MAERDTPNLVLLREVAQRIESLLPRLAFLGGVVVDLFVTEPSARPSRATKDVDVVIDRLHYWQYADRRIVRIGVCIATFARLHKAYRTCSLASSSAATKQPKQVLMFPGVSGTGIGRGGAWTTAADSN